MKLHADSHTDHVPPAVLAYLLERFGDHRKPFKVTIELPIGLPLVECNLHGPAAGTARVSSKEAHWTPRPGREYASRTTSARGPHLTAHVTVIAGAHDGEPCVLFTAYGGPLAPKEPTDPTLTDDEREESISFWSEHGLSVPG